MYASPRYGAGAFTKHIEVGYKVCPKRNIQMTRIMIGVVVIKAAQRLAELETKRNVWGQASVQPTLGRIDPVAAKGLMGITNGTDPRLLRIVQ